MMNGFWAAMRKDLKILLKDPGALVMLFILPLVFILVMSFAMESMLATGAISIAVADEDKSGFGDRLLRVLTDSHSFAVTSAWDGRPLDRATAEQLVKRRQVQFAVIVPPVSQASGSAERELLLDADPSVLPQVLAPVRSTVYGLAQLAAASGRAAPAGGATFPTALEPGAALAASTTRPPADAPALVAVRDDSGAGSAALRKPNSIEQNVPGYALFGLFFIAMQLAANVVDERQQGTSARLLAAPLPRWAVLGAKLSAFALVNVIQVVVLFLVGIWVLPLFGAPGMTLGAHPLGLVVVTLAIALAANSLGLLLATLTRTRAQAAGLGSMLVITLAMLGGVMVPRYVMPDFMQKLGWISPHTWGLMAYQDVLIRGADIPAILPQVGILLAFAAAFFSLALWRFRWE
jgi:ABC-2 type transport system permease protein